MRKGNRLTAMIMAAILAAGTVTGPVFAADYTMAGEFLTEAGTIDSLSENGEMTAETAQEDGLLSSDPASEADGSVSEAFEMDGSVAEPAAEDQESVSALSTTAADWSEDGNTTDAQLPEGAEFAEGGDEITDPADSAASEATDQTAVEETPVEAGEGTEAEAVEDAETPGDADTSADGAASVDETDDVTSGITDGGEMISDETPGADQEPDENPAPADVNEGQNADAEVLEEPRAGETVSEEQAVDGEETFNPIYLYETSLELSIESEKKIYVENINYYYEYNNENIKSAESSDSDVLMISECTTSYIIVSAKKPGTAKVTIEGTYGTVLTLDIKIVFNPICLYETYQRLSAESEQEIQVWNDTYSHDYIDENIKSAESSDSNKVMISECTTSYVKVTAKKAGTAKVTIEGTYGTVLTVDIFVCCNPIAVGESSLELVAGGEEQIELWKDPYSYDYYYTDEHIESAESSDSNVLMVSECTSSYVKVTAKKPGTAKVTIEGTYGTVLTVQVKVVSLLEKNSVTVKADNKTKVNIKEYAGCGDWYYAYYNHYKVSSSNKNVATGSIVEDEDGYSYVLAIKGISLGNAVITVKDNETGGISTISVKVEKPSFSLDETEISFKASDYYYLNTSGSNIKTAVSSNTSVFTTEKTGDRTVCLKPVKPGKATVTVTNNFGEARKATVTVITFLAITNLNLTAGNIREISESSLFSGSDYWEWGKNLTTSNKNIVTVSGKTYYDSFLFTGEYPGKATINVRCGRTGVTVPLSVTVVAPSFDLSTSKLTIDKVKTWYVTASGSDIGKVSSSNTKILKVEKVNSRRVKLIPVAHGTATLTFTSIYGVKRTVSAAVSYNYFKALLTSKTRTGTMLYGYTVLRGITAPSAAVSVRIGGKTYTAKADSSGIYKIQKVPVVKYGTNLKLTYKLCGTSITKTVKVGKGNSRVSSPYIYKDSTKIPVTVTNAHGGDKIVISIGGKQYTNKIGKAYSRTTINVPISKPNKYGIKMTIKLNNKFNQQLASYSAYVYLRNMVRKGDTKAIVKWIPRWNSPSEKDVSSYGENWWYEHWDEDDYYDAYLSFDEKGKVDDWTLYYD